MYIEQVKDFMLTAGQPVNKKSVTLDTKRAELRLGLILEELEELSVALGQHDVFRKLIELTLKKKLINCLPNKVEQLDAYCDLQYVLSGAILESGMGNVFEDAFKEVHKSNMSKFCIDREEALATQDKYLQEEISTSILKVNEKLVVYRVSDNKILKSINYKPVNLNRYIYNLDE